MHGTWIGEKSSNASQPSHLYLTLFYTFPRTPPHARTPPILCASALHLTVKRDLFSSSPTPLPPRPSNPLPPAQPHRPRTLRFTRACMPHVSSQPEDESARYPARSCTSSANALLRAESILAADRRDRSVSLAMG